MYNYKPPTPRELYVFHAWHNGKTLKEIGATITGTGKERTRQIREKTRRKLIMLFGLPRPDRHSGDHYGRACRV